MLNTVGIALMIIGVAVMVVRRIWPNHLPPQRIVYQAPLYIGLILTLIAAFHTAQISN